MHPILKAVILLTVGSLGFAAGYHANQPINPQRPPSYHNTGICLKLTRPVTVHQLIDALGDPVASEGKVYFAESPPLKSIAAHFKDGEVTQLDCGCQMAKGQVGCQ